MSMKNLSSMETKKKIWEEIHALIEVIWASEKMPDNW